MEYSVFDLECDGLNPTLIHCLSIETYDGDNLIYQGSTTDYDQMRNFFAGQKVIVGHNIKRFDIPVVEKLLEIKVESRIIDTLGLSWYLFPNRKKHGLEYWGEDFDIPKPKITDWENLPIEEYIYRCEEDVKINSSLFHMEIELLRRIYGSSEGIDRIIGYLMFKLDCAREQEVVKWKLDIEKCQVNMNKLIEERHKKTEELAEAMPESVKMKLVQPPEKRFKKDGEVSHAGANWFYLLGSMGLPIDYGMPVEVEVSRDRGNPDSPAQLKDWLFSLGWEPDVFKYDKEDDGSIRKIPQICNDDEDKTLSPSVQKLVEANPSLAYLQSYFLLRHRIGVLEGFLKNADENNYLMARVQGFTNTLRFQHTEIVNLPAIPKPYWEEVRGVLTHPEGMLLCGSDMSSLEDNTKQHYMYYYDPQYVTEMRTPGFDPHLDIAKLSGLLTEEQVNEHKLSDKTKGAEGKSHKAVRGKAKKVNFAAVYGAGPPKIQLTSGMSLDESKLLHSIYWKRNWSVKKIARDCTVKKVNGQMWLYNPVSQFWYSLRFEKDRFSTLNQGTGVYVFDSYVRQVRSRGIKLCGQFHDEIVFPLEPEAKERTTKLLYESIAAVNAELKLNVPLKISIDYGEYYSDIH